MTEKYMTVKEVAEYLGCGKTLAYKMFRRKNFPCVLIGDNKSCRRVKKSKLDAYLETEANKQK